ncbi:DJ-1/PfpI family protein [Paenibacillus athensensis]|uniref:DJ-1/PfpI domain-containing protein n=1 Tax=Paenibacillus athensensis TaxID=1967502 RepID=A0A4Y8PYV5_9BACL|nr:DJ-1/PfpI family protein [Paenibacillus athensensis]MCD1260416.1 DJ-1/PfpI family protein [Paenibacillus athensensis]
MLSVQMVLFDGFDLMDAVAPYEVFAAAQLICPDALQISFVSAEGARIVPSGMNGPGLPAAGALDPDKSGIVLIPGAMGSVDPADIGPTSVVAQLLAAKDSGLMPLIRQALRNERLTVSTVCGGSLLLAMDGLLADRYASTHTLGREALVATGARFVDARVVVDGRLVTGGGVTSGLDVALYLVEREWGPQVAHAVERLFEYERRGTVWRAEGRVPAHTAGAPAEPADAPLQAGQTSVAPNPVAATPLDETAADSPAVFDGSWQTTIFTPIGKQQVVLHIIARDGVLRGSAAQGDDIVAFVDPVITGNRMMWSQRVTKPMSLNLKFDVSVQGKRLSGTARAGLLPPSRVEGVRLKPQV